MMLSAYWTSGEISGLLLATIFYALLVIGCTRIAGSERKWRETRRELARENLNAILDTESLIRFHERRLEHATHPGIYLDAGRELQALRLQLKQLRKKEADYGYVAQEEDGDD